jgi:hypothetical protein
VNAFFFSWNPDLWEYDTGRAGTKFRRDGYLETTWSVQAHRMVRQGDRALFLKQGGQGRGLFALGYVVTPAFASSGWREGSETAFYVWLRFFAWTVPTQRLLMTKEEIAEILQRKQLNVYASGTPVTGAVGTIGQLWDLANQTAKTRGAFGVPPEASTIFDPLVGRAEIAEDRMCRAFSTLKFSKKEINSIYVLYDEDNHSGTDNELGEAAGDEPWETLNEHLRSAGKKVSEALGIYPIIDPLTNQMVDDIYGIIVEQRDANATVWKLRPQVVYAIRKEWEEFETPFEARSENFASSGLQEAGISDADRKKCLEAHQYRCWNCGFDEKAKYVGIAGTWMTVIPKPSHSSRKEGETLDPTIDLVPVCGRCLKELRKCRSPA